MSGRTYGPVRISFLLCCFWIYLAYGAYSEGNTSKALVFLGVGAALTAWRWSRMRSVG